MDNQGYPVSFFLLKGGDADARKEVVHEKDKRRITLCWSQGLSKRQTARSCGISRPAVDEYLRRAEAAGLGWPLPAEMDDGALERLPAGYGARGALVRGSSGTNARASPCSYCGTSSPDARLSVHLVLPAVKLVMRQGSGR